MLNFIRIPHPIYGDSQFLQISVTNLIFQHDILTDKVMLLCADKQTECCQKKQKNTASSRLKS